MSTTTCRAKNPATCPVHGNPLLSFTQFFSGGKTKTATTTPKMYGLSIRAYERAYRDQILADIEINRNLQIDAKTGEKTVSIFRSGVPSAPTERGIEKTSYEAADSYAPAGRQGRQTGVFASANLDSALRWYKANGQDWSKIEDYGLREMRVNPDTTYVYSVNNWERASNALYDDTDPATDPEFQTRVKQFWSQSMTLTAWYQYVKDNPELDTRDWEILVNAKDIKQVKPVPPKRTLDNCIREADRKNIEQLLKSEARAKRLARQAA